MKSPEGLAETGYPLFPGENEVEQLACMMEVLGIPSNSVLEHASRKKMFFGMSNRGSMLLNKADSTPNKYRR